MVRRSKRRLRPLRWWPDDGESCVYTRHVSLTPTKAPPMGAAGFAFIAGMLVYSVFRAVLVGETLGEYGINPWAFLFFDAGSAVPLAWGQVRLVQGLKRNDPRLVQRSLMVVIVAFISPYAYLVLGAGRPLPTLAYVVIALLIVFVGAATVWRIRSEARSEGRRENLPDL